MEVVASASLNWWGISDFAFRVDRVWAPARTTQRYPWGVFIWELAAALNLAEYPAASYRVVRRRGVFSARERLWWNSDVGVPGLVNRPAMPVSTRPHQAMRYDRPQSGGRESAPGHPATRWPGETATDVPTTALPLHHRSAAN